MTTGTMIITIIGLLGSIITIYELINKIITNIRSSNKNIEMIIKQILGIANLFLIAFILGLYLYQYNLNIELRSIEKQASVILNDKVKDSSIGEKRAYIYECFVFLEKHKDNFPESYKLANDYLQSNNILEKSMNSWHDGPKLEEACETMQGFIKGIAIIK